jgi:hypothetical protein
MKQKKVKKNVNKFKNPVFNGVFNYLKYKKGFESNDYLIVGT